MGKVGRHKQHGDLLLGELLRDGADAPNRGRARPLGERGNPVPDRAGGRGGDLVEGGADRGAEVIVEAVGLGGRLRWR